MSLTPTRDQREALLFSALVTPRNPARVAAIMARAPERKPAAVKPQERAFFDPENQPRGMVGRMPENPVLPCIVRRPAVKQEKPLSAFSAKVWDILNCMCWTYSLDPADLMDGPGRYCAEARQEAYYTLMTACGLSSREVGRLMRRRYRTVLAGAHAHARRHDLPVTWTRGCKPGVAHD